MSEKLCWLILIVVLVGITPALYADPLPLLNGSFEYKYADEDDGNNSIYDMNTWAPILGHMAMDSTAATGEYSGCVAWNNDGDFIGVDITCPNATETPDHCWFLDATDGIAACYTQHKPSEISFWQVLDYDIQLADMYTVTFDAMAWEDMYYDVRFCYVDVEDYNNIVDMSEEDNYVYIGPIALGEDPEDWDTYYTNDEGISWGYGPDAFDKTTTFVVKDPAFVGKPLAIKFTCVGEDSDWGFVDNIRAERDIATKAYSPSPANRSLNIGLETTKLTWKPGYWADTHVVYFGTDFEDVNAAEGSSSPLWKGEYDVAEWTIDESLKIAQTYYWRIDESNSVSSQPPGCPEEGPWKGNVWRFTMNDGKASKPYPANNSTMIPLDVELFWAPGIKAAYHDVYFGTDFNDVNDANTTTLGIYKGPPLPLDVNTWSAAGEDLQISQTYYWRIDEVNDNHPDKFWRGRVWNFRATDYLDIEDFDAYGSDKALTDVWVDGFTNELSGSEIHPETAIVHRGSRSIEFRYRNFEYNEKFSEIMAKTYPGSGPVSGYLEFGRDWNESSAHALALWFYGQEDNIASSKDIMYIAIEDTSSNFAMVEYYGDMNDIKVEEWQEWNIPLDEFTGVDINHVQYVYIGLGIRGSTTTPGGTGYVYFDELRLHTTRCVPKLAYMKGSFGHLNADCITDNFDLAMLSYDWLRQGYQVESTEPVPGPNRWYQLNDDLIDSGSDELNGTMPEEPNDPEFTSGGYDDSNCLYFDNSVKNPDYADIPPFGLNTNTLTITTWLKGDMGDGLQHIYAGIVWTRDSNTGADIGICFGADTDTWDRTNELTYFWEGFYWDWHSGLIVPEEEWVFVALVVEPDQATLYLNEAEAGSEVLKRAINPAPHHIITIDETDEWFGRLADNAGTCFGGWMDDVRIYNRALTTGEVLYLALGSEAPSYFLHLDKFRADANKDDIVDFKDYAIMADYWLEEIWFPFP